MPSYVGISFPAVQLKAACHRVGADLVRVEASRDLSRWDTYLCLECGARTRFRCGTIYAPHFSHASSDPLTLTCSLRSAPAETQVTGGRFFSSRLDQAPIREVQFSQFPEPKVALQRSSRLRLWLVAKHRRGAPWTFRFALGLPQLGMDTPDLEGTLQGLELQVTGAELPESQAWRLWPSIVEPVPVPLLERYALSVDPHWPEAPPWRKGALEGAQVELFPQGNAFLVEDREDGDIRALLAPAPTTLLAGSRVLNLTQDPESPPPEFKPTVLGDHRSMGESWRVWDLTLPQVGGLSPKGAAWMESRAWRMAQDRTVRIVSPPPVAFEGLVPVYPSGRKGWAIIESQPETTIAREPRAWLMDSPAPGTRFTLPEGRAPNLARCREFPITWADIPYPELLLLRDSAPFETIPLCGMALQKVVAGIDVRRLGWVFRSIIPLEVLAGPPGSLCPLIWQPAGRLLGLEECIRSAIQTGSPYQILIRGRGVPRQVIEFKPSDQPQPRPRRETYHTVLRQRAGWPPFACH